MAQNQPFYAKGLSFSCTRCSACCRYESGYVFLSKTDVSRLARECKLPDEDFIKTYCRWIPSLNNTERLSLKEKANLDCIFWGAGTLGSIKTGCKVYNSRPLQCSTFPFWPNVLANKEAWEATAEDCPGMDQGELHSLREIKTFLKNQQAEPAITRNSGGL